jgi:sugar phosphate isomerase/epimerase
MQRRDFLKAGSGAAVVATLFRRGGGPGDARAADPPQPAPSPVPVHERLCLFTDHLDDFGYSYAEVAKMLSPLKIAGPDLTVRPGGLVPPERVAEELPKAAAAFRDQGMSIPMVTTTLTSADSPAAQPIFATMHKLRIRYYKLGYYHYPDLAHWEAELDSQRKNLAGLLALGRQAQAHAGFHNHAGAGIGGALWDAWELLRPLDPAEVGFYFDPAHATIEGSKHAWKLNFQRVSPRITMVALKDFVWEKTAGGWQTRWCPLGEGMVNWKEFFRMLAQVPFPGPLSVHIEYNPGGSTRPERIDNSLAAAQRDLAFVRKHLAEAFDAK